MGWSCSAPPLRLTLGPRPPGPPRCLLSGVPAVFSCAFPWLESWCLWCHLCSWLPWASPASCYCASLPKTSGSRPPSRCTRSLRRWEAAGPGVRGCLAGTVGARQNALRSHTSAELCLRPGPRFHTSFYFVRGVTATLPEPRGTGGKVCRNSPVAASRRSYGSGRGAVFPLLSCGSHLPGLWQEPPPQVQRHFPGSTSSAPLEKGIGSRLSSR